LTLCVRSIRDLKNIINQGGLMSTSHSAWQTRPKTACLVFADGTVIYGYGVGSVGEALGEICFNTSITGYQEILTDPSYAGQIIAFTFPHVGNVGTNGEDIETVNMAGTSGVRGCILKADITEPSNYRNEKHLDAWLKSRDIIGISGIDTRSLTGEIRDKGFINAVIAHNEKGEFDLEALKAKAAAWDGLEGADLAKEVTCTQSYKWDEKVWEWDKGFAKQEHPNYKVVAIDYGAKRNILRCLATAGCDVKVVPANTPAKDILAENPDGVFLSNGPGDPAATGEYAVAIVKEILEHNIPVFGICLGHQILSLACGAKTVKMHQGHHGANHPVKDLTTGKVEITSMNHGFAVDEASLPETLEQTHVSLFDGTNCGIMHKEKPAFSVQYHPEASPGPQDSYYLFKRFVHLMQSQPA